MLRRIIMLSFILFIFNQSASADTGVELFLANVNIQDAKTQYGGGCSVMTGIGQDLWILVRGTYTVYYDERTVWDTKYDITYSHFTCLAGIEYEPPVDTFVKYRLHWRNTVCMGFSSTEVEVDNGEKHSSAGDSGFAYAVNTGLGYDYSQLIQFFAEAGWHQSLYNGELNNSDIFGFQFFAGVRFAFSGNRRNFNVY